MDNFIIIIGAMLALGVFIDFWLLRRTKLKIYHKIEEFWIKLYDLNVREIPVFVLNLIGRVLNSLINREKRIRTVMLVSIVAITTTVLSSAIDLTTSELYVTDNDPDILHNGIKIDGFYRDFFYQKDGETKIDISVGYDQREGSFLLIKRGDIQEVYLYTLGSNIIKSINYDRIAYYSLVVLPLVITCLIVSKKTYSRLIIHRNITILSIVFCFIIDIVKLLIVAFISNIMFVFFRYGVLNIQMVRPIEYIQDSIGLMFGQAWIIKNMHSYTMFGLLLIFSLMPSVLSILLVILSIVMKPFIGLLRYICLHISEKMVDDPDPTKLPIGTLFAVTFGLIISIAKIITSIK